MSGSPKPAQNSVAATSPTAGWPVGAMPSALLASRARAEQHKLLGGSALSIVLHALLVILMLFYWPHHGSRSGASSRHRDVLVISLDRGDVDSKQLQPVPKPQPQVAPPPQPVPPPLPKTPEPATPVAKPVTPVKPKVEKKAPAAAQPQASASSTEKQQNPQPPDPNADSDELLQGVRAHWLQPPATRRDFHCRIKIDYQPGGIISAVTVQEGCGGSTLDDSVERAIWKTQPLPIPAQARNQGGSLMFDFTP